MPWRKVKKGMCYFRVEVSQEMLTEEERFELDLQGRVGFYNAENGR